MRQTMASVPGDYVHFKGQVPLHRISIGTNHWRFYDYGPKSVEPVVCLCGIAGTADVFYKQILSLSAKGYRVIAADSPSVRNHLEWVTSFEKFLDALGVHHVHLYGTSLGGFLAQLFAQYRFRRVKSLLLSNTFLDTRPFHEGITWASFITWTPEFVLKRYILSGIRDGPQEPWIADSIDFVVGQLETLTREELASRLILNTAVASIGQLPISDSAITIMDTNDYCAVPQMLKDQVAARYPGARRAHLKSGGDFPFLSRAGEVTLHLQLHLMRAGVEGIVPPEGKYPVPKDTNGNSADFKDETLIFMDRPSRTRDTSLRRLAGDDLPGSSSSTLFRNSGQLDSSRYGSLDAKRRASFSNREIEKPQALPRSWSNISEVSPQVRIHLLLLESFTLLNLPCASVYWGSQSGKVDGVVKSFLVNTWKLRTNMLFGQHSHYMRVSPSSHMVPPSLLPLSTPIPVSSTVQPGRRVYGLWQGYDRHYSMSTVSLCKKFLNGIMETLHCGSYRNFANVFL